MTAVRRRLPPREKLAFLRARVAQHQYDDAKGRRVPRLAPKAARQAAAKAATPARRRKITKEDEAGVLQLLARGTAQHDIARRYHVTVDTIRRIRSQNILPKPRKPGDWVFRDGKWGFEADAPALRAAGAL